MHGLDRKRLAVRFSSTLATIGLYLPVLAGIITPMLWLLPAWYTAWHVVGFIFPFSDIWGGLWLPFWGDSSLPPVLLLAIGLIEVMLFLGGLGISIWGGHNSFEEVTCVCPQVMEMTVNCKVYCLLLQNRQFSIYDSVTSFMVQFRR